MAMTLRERIKHPEADLELARQIVLQGLAGYPAKVFLFGSHATGRAKRASDIDIAILPENDLPDTVFADIRERLEESQIIYLVDLLNLLIAGETLRARVLAEGVPWNA